MVSKQEPQVIVVPDTRTLAQAAADRLLAQIALARGSAAVCLTGGASPEGLYRLLAQEPYREALPWSRVHWFMGDDRFVPADDPLSNIGMARRAFLDHVPAPARNIHPIATQAASPDAAARRYEAELRAFYQAERAGQPLFDLVLMGLGSDGHTASLFPRAAALDEQERWVVGVAEAGLAPFVPRVTLTFPALASTREMLFLVDGRDKRDVLNRVFGGQDLPAGRARADGALVWLLDRSAAPEAQHAS